MSGTFEVTAKPEPLILRLYVAGESPNSLRAIANLEALCLTQLANRCQVEIVDIFDEPMRLFADGVLVTPTLVRVTPLPVQRLVGDLSDSANVLMALGLNPKTGSSTQNPMLPPSELKRGKDDS